MKVYYNKFFSSHPFVDLKDHINFDVNYCGDTGLLSLFMLHGGIPTPQETPEERRAIYHNHLLRNSESLIKDTIYEDSFHTDSYATACKILEWRDSLVAIGWSIEQSFTKKLNFLKSVEPVDFPHGLADCWKEIIEASSKRLLLPKGSELTVCHNKEDLEPRLISIFNNQSNLGLTIYYYPIKWEDKGDDISRLKQWLIKGNNSKLEFSGDGTLNFLSFDNDENALKYIASQDPEEWTLYLCQQPKKFDNILRYLGQPVCGSDLTDCEPQVVNLFLIGNGLFEYPLNLERILAWLQAPVSPLGRSLSNSLAHSLSTTGGVNNKEWHEAIQKYLDNKELSEKEREKMLKNINDFIPLPNSNILKCKDVIWFNEKLKNWSNGILFLNEFPYEDIVREQLRQIETYCQTLVNLLKNYDKDTIKFIDLQNWCSTIMNPSTYTQYEPELGCRNVISCAGNIFSNVDSMVWFCICDSDVKTYPFDFLTDKEINLLEKDGVLIYDRKKFNSFFRNSMINTVLSTNSLTLVEASNVNGEKMKRHPLMIQINEALEGGIKKKMITPKISSDKFKKTQNIDNRSDNCYVKIDETVKIPLRIDYGQQESYSSIDLLIQHPFDYICKYIAELKDTRLPSIDDLKRTQGNVAHKMIELLFLPGSKGIPYLSEEDYQKVFDDAIRNTGLLLLRPENIMHYNDVRMGMRDGITKLSEFIKNNELTIDGSEVELDMLKWIPDCVNLGSRCDMLLTDANGDKVVLDFKWSHVPTSYIDMVKEGLSAQLIIYSFLINKHYGCKVRSAYVSFPDCRIITTDHFLGVEPFEEDTTLSMEEKVTKMANGVKFRQQQFEDHIIEHTEGMEPEESEYYEATEIRDLFPLKLYKYKLSSPYDRVYLNLK